MENGSDSDEPEDFVLKRANHGIEDGVKDTPSIPLVAPTQKQLDKAREKDIKERGRGQKFHFDEDGNTILSYALETLDEFESGTGKDVVAAGVSYGQGLKEEMERADVGDKARQKERRKEEKRERKRKIRERDGLGGEGGEEREVVLGGGEDAEQEEEDEGEMEIDMNESEGSEGEGLDIDMSEEEEDMVLERPAKKSKKSKKEE
jgi:hypothetical protein